MAYSNLLSLENIIREILDHDRFPISPHEKEHIISIDKYVSSFQAFLEEFLEKAKIVEARIRDVVVEAENILEFFLDEGMYTEWMATPGGIHQLQRVRDEMESIAAEVVEIQNRIIIKDKQLGDSVVATSSSSQVEDSGKINVVGFNKDLEKVKEGLCGQEPQLQVLPILGMGGIGKTTLARSVYDDKSITEQFHVRVWVSVSQDYSYGRILFNIVDSLKEFSPDWRKETRAERSESVIERSLPVAERSEEGSEFQEKICEMEVKVCKILAGRRFLIVMDDIWNTNVLDDVKHLFPNYNNGSRIMLTTRLAEVATYYAKYSTLTHQMRFMDLDQSWDLLSQKVFMHQDGVPRELKSIGRVIARSCGGLPLAIVVIAGVLSTVDKTVTSWKEVARDTRSSFATADRQIENMLSLSYSHLPHHLRPCFLYMGGFPEDHEIKVTDVIKLWIAETFVRPVASKELENTAEEYLEDLVDRNLILVTERKSNGKIRFCGLHDAVREMCIKLSREEKFLMHVKDSKSLDQSTDDLQRVSISHSYNVRNTYSSTIRTIIYFDHTLHSFESFRLLRILYLLTARSHKASLCDQLFKLSHLRFLAFCYSHTIPRAISNLQSLQTLIIKEISDKCLPCEIWNMPQLRHLIISKIRLPDTDTATSTLENLQTLEKVENLMCLKSILNLIPNLTKLWLSYSKGSGELLFQNLVHLHRLEKLHLELGFGWSCSGEPILVVPSSLKQLTLTGWGRGGTYLQIFGPFPNLEVLKLKSFNFNPRVWRTTEADYFPQLKYLRIEESDLKQWDAESGHFPTLKSLHIHSCPGLTQLPECIGEFPSLELIELKFCTGDLADSAKRIQEDAKGYGNEVLQVRCIDCQPSYQLIQHSLYEEAMKKSWREHFLACI